MQGKPKVGNTGIKSVEVAVGDGVLVGAAVLLGVGVLVGGITGVGGAAIMGSVAGMQVAVVMLPAIHPKPPLPPANTIYHQVPSAFLP